MGTKSSLKSSCLVEGDAADLDAGTVLTNGKAMKEFTIVLPATKEDWPNLKRWMEITESLDDYQHKMRKVARHLSREGVSVTVYSVGSEAIQQMLIDCGRCPDSADMRDIANLNACGLLEREKELVEAAENVGFNPVGERTR